jgi:hypothetical protein
MLLDDFNGNANAVNESIKTKIKRSNLKTDLNVYMHFMSLFLYYGLKK